MPLPVLGCSGLGVQHMAQQGSQQDKAGAIARAEEILEEAGWDDWSIGQVSHDLLRQRQEDTALLTSGSKPRVVAALKAFSTGELPHPVPSIHLDPQSRQKQSTRSSAHRQGAVHLVRGSISVILLQG